MTTKPRLFIQMLTEIAKASGIASLTALSVIHLISQPSNAQSRNRYFCAIRRGIPTTFARTPRGNVPMISWVSNLGGRDPQQRCLEITERFQNFSDNGMLRFLRTGTINGLPVLCVARFRGGSCDRSSVLITLQAGQDPQLVRQQLIDIASRASSGPIRLRSNEVIFYEDGEPYVNVDKLLETAPVDSESSS